MSRDIKTQKFWHGDLVLISDDVSEVKRNFSTGVRGIVDGSFADKFHDHNAIDQYSVHVEGGCRVSWYDESELTLVEENRRDMLIEWTNEKRRAMAREE